MTSIWLESLGRNFDTAFDLMATAVQDCSDELWHASMWAVHDGDDPAREVRDADGCVVTDPAERRALVQLYSTPWAVSWHALERLDFILTAGRVPWEIWPGFAGRTGYTPPPVRSVWEPPYGGLDVTTISEPWSRGDLLAFTDYCRQRVNDSLEGLTDEMLATRLSRRGEPHASRLIDKLGHVIEHGSQIRQFITAASMASESCASRTRVA